MNAAIVQGLEFSDLDAFVASNIDKRVARKQICIGPVTIYVRITTRSLGEKVERTLDLADVTVIEECRGKGIFRALLAHSEALSAKYGLALYVESISSPIVHQALSRRGYQFKDGELGSAWLSHRTSSRDSNSAQNSW